MYDDVLVPTDGSEGVREAILEGVDLAELCDAAVHALYVVDERSTPDLPDVEWQSVRSSLENEGEESVATVTGEAKRRGLDATSDVRHGDPAETILTYADEQDVDAIVMGTHGRSGVSRYLLGSVTERVVRQATIPVVVVRIGEEGEGDEHAGGE
ncbi:universal stress protein [Halospeciosus flavus]|uniref:Universal stress protein n=1 Tax=Halospeciosus flavus TaxID=3032283 RepID=A0ABD5Z597_9EURY|nr:universal stress protein [Halospeciosus flavus]